MIKLITYDLDGTLIDSANTVHSIINEMRKNLGKEPIDKKKLIPWISLGGTSLISNALGIDLSYSEKKLIEFRSHYLNHQSSESDLYPGLITTLNSLIKNGKKIAICTNKPRILVEKILTELRLTDYFDFILAGGDLPTQKPHPNNLLKCLEYFKCSVNSAYFVGDSTVDQILADTCKVPFVFFRPGYDDGVDLSRVSLILDSHDDLISSRHFWEN